MKNRISFYLLLVFIGTFLLACKTSSKSEKYYERQDKKKSEIEQKEYDKQVEGHKSRQSKNTLKMIKKTEKEARKLNKSKKPKLKKC